MAQPRGGDPFSDWYRRTSKGVEKAKAVLDRQARQAQQAVNGAMRYGQDALLEMQSAMAPLHPPARGGPYPPSGPPVARREPADLKLRGPLPADRPLAPIAPTSVWLSSAGGGAPLQYKTGKGGALIDRLSPEIRQTYPQVVQAWSAAGLPTPVITSGRDGKHKVGSLHYEDQAYDLRGNNFTNKQGYAVRDDLKRRLGPDYDVLFETFSDPINDHIHIEYQPKRRTR